MDPKTSASNPQGKEENRKSDSKQPSRQDREVENAEGLEKPGTFSTKSKVLFLVLGLFVIIVLIISYLFVFSEEDGVTYTSTTTEPGYKISLPSEAEITHRNEKINERDYTRVEFPIGNDYLSHKSLEMNTTPKSGKCSKPVLDGGVEVLEEGSLKSDQMTIRKYWLTSTSSSMAFHYNAFDEDVNNCLNFRFVVVFSQDFEVESFSNPPDLIEKLEDEFDKILLTLQMFK